MKIKGTEIYMTRGDSECITVSCKKEGILVPFVEGDQVEMTVRKFAGGGTVLLKKTVLEFTEEGKALVQIEPADTSGLMYCTASYDIQVTFANGQVKTIIEPSRFEIGKENTYAE